MRRSSTVFAFAALMIAACASTSPAGSVTSPPAASEAATPVSSPSPQPSPSTVTDLPLTFPTFICKLPISTPDTRQAAFIAVGAMGTVEFVEGVTGVRYYDRAFSRWLPVGRQAVSPDGTHYATVDAPDEDAGTFTVHIVDVPSGVDHAYRQKLSATGIGAAEVDVFDYTTAGIYLTQAFEHVWPGVWLFDPRTNTVRSLAAVPMPELSGDGGIWYGDVNPADANPLVSGTSAGILPDEIYRLDVKTGARTLWMYEPGHGLYVIGLDTGGRPLIAVVAPVANPQPKTDPIDHASAELLLGLDPNSRTTIFKGPLAESLGGPIADAHGVWFGSTQGIYLYTPAGGLEKISNQPAFPANGCF
jgi:(2Fe-2S) ferredoxin